MQQSTDHIHVGISLIDIYNLFLFYLCRGVRASLIPYTLQLYPIDPFNMPIQTQSMWVVLKSVVLLIIYNSGN